MLMKRHKNRRELLAVGREHNENLQFDPYGTVSLQVPEENRIEGRWDKELITPSDSTQYEALDGDLRAASKKRYSAGICTDAD